MKKLLAPAIGVLALFGVAACSPDSKDFQSEGEDFIEDDDGQLARSVGYTFEDADCDKPRNTEVGTTYSCTAVDNEGDDWDFLVEITGKRELTAQAYHAKLLQPVLVDQLGTLGSVDEACVDEQLAALSGADVRAIIDDLSSDSPTVNDESQAVFDNLALNCVN